MPIDRAPVRSRGEGRTPAASVLLTILLGSLSLLACASTHHAYEGAPRPAAEVAQLRALGGTLVMADTDEIFAKRVVLLPRPYRLAAQFNLSGDEIAPGVSEDRSFRLICRFELDPQPGYAYRIQVEDPNHSHRRGSATRYSYVAGIYDEEDDRLIANVTTCGWKP